MITAAMILAAGYGSRLKPLTDDTPKAVIPYNGKPMIEYVIEKLIAAGINEITINTHYIADKIKVYLKSKTFAAKINLTYEKEILGIGGGIKNAKRYLQDSGDFLVHNVDVDSDINISGVYEYHARQNALATLCVKKRETTRQLLIDRDSNLIGRVKNGNAEFYRESTDYSETAFCGVYVLSARIFDLFPTDDIFDIIPFFLSMVKRGEKLVCFDIGDTYWKDLGKIEDLHA